MTYTHLSLFSGMGGFDLGAEWAGFENIAHCENNPILLKVLHYYWPNAIQHENIQTTDFAVYRGKVFVLSGGFPCQPYSMAEKRKGTEDPRHLWPQMLRAIREIRPRWVIAENVSGLVNWAGGLVFNEVQTDLEAEGYEVQPFILPAAGINAPHKRERVFIVAYSNHNGQHSSHSSNEKHTSKTRQHAQRNFKPLGKYVANPNSTSAKNKIQARRHKFGGVFYRHVINSKCQRWNEVKYENGKFKKPQEEKRRKIKFSGTNSAQNQWRHFPTQSPVCFGNDGLPAGLDGITLSKWRQEAIKAAGNAIVPQLFYHICETIKEFENAILNK